MVLDENIAHTLPPLIADLDGLEIPNHWLGQRQGTKTPTSPVDLAYLEHVASLIIDPSPIPYDIWYQVCTSLYTTINYSRHEGAHKLWLAFLRKGITLVIGGDLSEKTTLEKIVNSLRF